MKAIADIVRRGLDARLPELLKAKEAAVRPTRGWLRAVREATGINQQALAKRLGVKRQSYARFEETEAQATISLASLQKAANALDCEVVYYLVPRPKLAGTYTELAMKHDPKLKHLQASEHSMALEGQAVGDLPPKNASRKK